VISDGKDIEFNKYRRFGMKTALLVSMVVGAHVIVIGGIMLTQGCGVSTRPLVDGQPPEPVMPPAVAHAESDVVPTPIAPVTFAPVTDLPAETSTYVVGKGESLSVIAREHGIRVADIVALNGIKNPNLVRAGQTLTLPGSGTVVSSVKTGSTPKKSSRKKLDIPAGATAYTVKKGDSLSVIAYKAGINISDLRAANGISGDKIFVNQKLIIPGGQISSAVAPAPVVAAPAVASAPVIAPVEAELVVDSPATITVEEPALDETAAMAVAPAKKIDNNLEVREYVVNEDDDDLYGVAMMWGVSVARLKEINKLSDTKLSVGQKLMIPVSE
jgi:LysM repeat protein